MPSTKPAAGSNPQRGRSNDSAFTKASLLLVISEDELPEFPLSSEIKASLAGHPGDMPTSLSHWIKIMEFENRSRRRA